MEHRTLTSHIVNPANDKITITVMDEPGQGGANHVYRIDAGGKITVINFQNGPINEYGVNGITQEVLLAICIDRLEGFQSGAFACEDNQIALDAMRLAQTSLQKRTRDRMKRGVEGTNIQ